MELTRQLFGGLSNDNSKAHLNPVEELSDNDFEEESDG